MTDDVPDSSPRKTFRRTLFSTPFKLRARWLLVVGIGLLSWQVDWTNWRQILARFANAPFEVSLLWLILPMGLAWWFIRRKFAKRIERSKRPAWDDEDAIRLVEPQERVERSAHLVTLIVLYVVAVLVLIGLATSRMLVGR